MGINPESGVDGEICNRDIELGKLVLCYLSYIHIMDRIRLTYPGPKEQLKNTYTHNLFRLPVQPCNLSVSS